MSNRQAMSHFGWKIEDLDGEKRSSSATLLVSGPEALSSLFF